ncbi:hypothetical protein [Pseudomonas sp. UFMG81]|jgi:hypothetical protein|uniref:hypothetical protein n=1 Tax=Pseudomonas sp. UFMG81 TaxID=2745936 RepID=UPI00188FEF17|nr:hypothetical protein [Pseudomonas sp. UFMG81]
MPRIRLICLACDRRQLARYQTWAHVLGEPIELVAVDITALTHTDQICATQTLIDHLESFLEQPHAIFGQQQGGCLALALTQLTQQRFPGQTRHLFVSGCDCPGPAASDVCEHGLQVPVTVLYPSGSLPTMLGWQDLAHRELELIELPAEAVDAPLLDQRLVSIVSTHLRLLSLQ